MFKKAAALFLFFLSLGVGVYLWQDFHKEVLLPNPSLTSVKNQASPYPQEEKLNTTSYNGKEFSYDFFVVDNLQKLSLLENKDKKDAKELIADNSCHQVINGGFYDTENKPLGLFISAGEEVYPQISSDLLDGFLLITQNGNFLIDKVLPTEDLRIGLQSGPLLIKKTKVLSLNIKNDKLARRMVAMQTKEDLLFLTVFEKEARFSGPMLADLPLVIKQIADKEKLAIINALNLDGGAASVFKSKKIFLNEYDLVGSLFCVKI